MNTLKNGLLAGVFAIGCVSAANAQVNASDSVMNHVKGNRLSVGGYGEVAYSRMFYSLPCQTSAHAIFTKGKK